tara:strand:- start:51 stop:317 length:267 start_codon:yes stop_codon:yes gene_type:complete
LQIKYVLQTKNTPPYSQAFVTQKLQRPIDYLQRKQRILKEIQNKKDRIKYLEEILPKRIQLIDHHIEKVGNKSKSLQKKFNQPALLHG